MARTRGVEVRLVEPTEVSEEFIQGMADRMAVSFHKYGPMAKNYPFPGNAIESLQKRLAKYEDTGNTEWLMDAANFCMIEFMRPCHPKAHFRPTSSRESPGLKVDGEGFVKDIAPFREAMVAERREREILGGVPTKKKVGKR